MNPVLPIYDPTDPFLPFSLSGRGTDRAQDWSSNNGHRIGPQQ
jgi:hypothetical protein